MAVQPHDRSEQLLVLLEEVKQSVMVENRALRLDMEKQNEAQAKAYQEIEQRLQDITNLPDTSPNISTNRWRKRRSEGKVVVPVQCRRITKEIHKNLKHHQEDFDGLATGESFESDNNRAICERVVNEVHHKHGGEQNCPWNRIVIEAVLRRYHISLCEKEKRVRNHKYEAHKKVCRKSGRQREKLSRRTAALERVNWDAKKKGKAAEILIIDAMSSEESCCESDAEGNQKVAGYTVKRLRWESINLSKMKRKLDKVYQKSLSKRASDRMLPREQSLDLSGRDIPEDFPEWAVNTAA